MSYMPSSLELVGWPAWSTLFWFSLASGVLILVKRSSGHQKGAFQESNVHAEPTAYPPVEPLPDFEWQTKEPLKLRPFKPKYNLTMAIEEATVSELIEMDKNYADRIALRKALMTDHPETVLGAEQCVAAAVNEFYSWMVETYLPTRFPRMFRLSPPFKPSILHNLVTNEKLPLRAVGHPIETLRVLGGLVDEDVLFLLPSDDGDGYTLKGFVTCFPNGFNTKEKLNVKLRDIHKPVPKYKEKLEKSMDRYFDKLKVGKFMKRANWTITTTPNLAFFQGTHLYEGDTVSQEEVNVENARFRCERQVVHRLPQSRAIILTIKTYLYTLSEIKGEGLGESLAQAIDGLREGNVPAFHFYKRAAIWGESAKAYLRN
ncbi:hypothetical protein BDV25DRAFT_137957 [Aspergillus avenaceus]|uniref:HRQ family protein 2 n=1 Tax=Aspergillus avenaceus TaxID=36643 RepID=A0A5N6U177_ASPAV|nr:hypothetical protein BDV25DRAFT_137957 [Aspergillus avenaceus]